MLGQFTKQWELPIYSLSLGFILGGSLISFSGKDLKTFSGMLGSTAATISVGYVAYKQIDPTAKFKQAVADNKVEITRLENERDSTIEHSLIHIKQLRLLETACDDLKKQISQLQSDLRLSAQNQSVTSEASQKIVTDLNYRLGALQANLEASQKDSAQTIQKLEDELNESERTFDDDIAKNVNQQVKSFKQNEITKVYKDFMPLTDEALELSLEADQIINLCYEISEGKDREVRQLNEIYLESMSHAHKKLEQQISVHIEETELFNEKIARLQQIASGKLLEPELLEAGYNLSFKAANDIALTIYRLTGIPLRVFAVSESESVYTVGLGVSKGVDRFEISQAVESHSEAIARMLNIHQIVDVSASDILEGIKVSFRLEPNAAMPDEQVYRHITKASQFGATLRKYHNHKEGGKPTLRVMSASGGGKGIAVKNLIDSYVKSEKGFEIWLSDPKSGSEEDYWHIPTLATSRSDSQKLFKEFVSEFDARANKTSQHSRTKVLGVFDEFDKEHTEKDKESAKRIWTAIRHHAMRMILIGQSGEVGSNGWTWDEMNNCTLLFIQDGIKTALKHYKDIGFGLKKKNELERVYESVSGWMKKKNENLSAEKKYRLGLLICGDHMEFLEIPPAIEGEILNGKSMIASRKWQSEASESVEENEDHRPFTVTSTVSKTPNPECPVCDEKMRSSGSSWACTNTSHTKEMGKKSYPKNGF